MASTAQTSELKWPGCPRHQNVSGWYGPDVKDERVSPDVRVADIGQMSEWPVRTRSQSDRYGPEVRVAGMAQMSEWPGWARCQSVSGLVGTDVGFSGRVGPNDRGSVSGSAQRSECQSWCVGPDVSVAGSAQTSEWPGQPRYQSGWVGPDVSVARSAHMSEWPGQPRYQSGW